MAIYNGEHSVTFSGNPYFSGVVRNTWDSYGLIPENRPTFEPQEMSYVDWSSYSQPDYLGLKNNLSKHSLPSSKKATWTFYSYHEKTVYHGSSDPATYNGTVDPDLLYRRLLRELHGRVWIIRLEDENKYYDLEDPDYYYVGLVEVTGWETQPHFSTVTLTITAEPYRFWDRYTGVNAYKKSAPENTSDNLGDPAPMKEHPIPMYTGVVTPIYIEFVIGQVLMDSLTIKYAAYDAITEEPHEIKISLNGIANNTRIRIDGENKTIRTPSGYNLMRNVISMWRFPSLLPQTSGTHTITFNTDWLTYVEVGYTSRFL